MKKAMAFVMVLACLCGLLGCGSQPPPAEPNAMIPMVQIAGVTYMTTGVESVSAERRDGFDGKITSSVKGSECPVEDDQSNFGEGFGYQFGAAEGTVDIYIDGSWWIYATEEVRDRIQRPEWYITLENPPALIVTLDDKTVEAKRGTMDWHSRTPAMTDTLTSANSAQSVYGNIPVLKLGSDSDLCAALFWDVKPDSVFVRCWGETGEDERTEFAPVKTGNEAGDSYLIELKDGNYTYKVLAKWESAWENAKTYGGECRYQFRTEK